MATSSRKKKTEQYPLDASGLIKTYKGKITSRRKIYRFFKILYTKYGLAFHPDDRFGDMTGEKDIPVFKNAEAKELDKIVDDCFEYCDKHKIDIHKIALEAKGKDKPSEHFDKGGLSGKDAWTGTAVEGGGGIKQPVYAKGGAVKEIAFETSNLWLVGQGVDVNGNHVVKIAFPNDRAFSIQTNGVLPGTNSILKSVDKLSEITAGDMAVIEKEVNAYVRDYGSAKQKKKLRIHGGEKFEKGGKPHPADKIATTDRTRQELGKLYEKVVGYDITEDDKGIGIAGIVELMMEYDAANKEEKPFINKNGYYFKNSEKDKWVENYRGYSIVEYAPDHYGILWDSQGGISMYIMDDPDFVKPGDKPITLEVTKKHIDGLKLATVKKAADGTVLETLQTDVHSGAGATPTEMQDDAMQFADGGEVNEKAQTILEQLGGSRKLQAMTGAVIFSTTNGIQIILKSKRAPYVYIDLNGKDLYDVKFGKFLKKEMKLKMVSEFTDVQADGLKSLVEKETEMRLSLEKGGIPKMALGGGLETLEYDRVIPRDFFNEAKLLKCMGLLALKILDRQLPNEMDIVIEETGEPFNIQLTSDGLLFVDNYPVTINGSWVFMGSTYNSKESYPLVAIIDYTEYPVFNDDGNFSEEFKTMPVSAIAKGPKPKKKMSAGGLPEDATQSQVFAKEGTELNSSLMIPNNQASVYTAEKLPFTGTNLEGKKLLNGDYIVLSFMCYPIWLYSSADGHWYGNKDKFNTITAMHQQESRPDFNAEMIPLHELYKKLFGSIQKFDLGGPVQQLYPMSLDNALEAHG